MGNILRKFMFQNKKARVFLANQTALETIPLAPVQIDVWSDISCPWCYIGKLRLDKAIQNVEAKLGTNPVVVKWHPYITDLKINPAGEDFLVYNQRKDLRWGSDSGKTSLKRIGAKDGATFSNWKWWPNSLNGHRQVSGILSLERRLSRLVSLAETVGKAAETKHALFIMTYEDGENISDLEVLCILAEKLGIPNAREYLVSKMVYPDDIFSKEQASEEGKQSVLEQDNIAKQSIEIKTVPYFIFNTKLAVSGARDTAYLEATIEKMLKET